MSACEKLVITIKDNVYQFNGIKLCRVETRQCRLGVKENKNGEVGQQRLTGLVLTPTVGTVVALGARVCSIVQLP